MKKLLLALAAGVLVVALPGCRDNNCYEPCDKPCKKECPPRCEKPCPKPCKKTCPPRCEKECPPRYEKRSCPGGVCPARETYETKKVHKADKMTVKKTKKKAANGNGTKKATNGNGMMKPMNGGEKMEMTETMMVEEPAPMPTAPAAPTNGSTQQ